MWPEIETASKEQRHELVLQGKSVADRVESNDGALDENVYDLVKLNFLEVADAKLRIVSNKLSSLTNLTSLVMKNNQLSQLPDCINSLTKLKLLDISGNNFSRVPTISQLSQLTTLNLSLNKLEGDLEIPGVDQCTKLTIVDVSSNSLTSLASLETAKLPQLSELVANHNQLESLASEVASNWSAIKRLDLSNNNLKTVPSQLPSLSKMKDLSLINNPLSDKRLRKLCEQKGTKSVLDYIKANGGKDEKSGKGGGKKNKKGNKDKAENHEDDVDDLSQTLKILSFNDSYPEIAVDDEVKEVRPYLVCCYVADLDLTGENMKKFLSLQTKLHKGICNNRTVATIATHDREKIKGPLLFTAKSPTELSIIPLMSTSPSTADKLVSHLRTEAEALRKEKKRSQVSGLHQYLHIVEKWAVYPCLLDGEEVISFPPVTNAANTRMSEETKSLLIEVSSSTKLSDAKLVMDTLLTEMMDIWTSLTVIQARVVSPGGELKVTYPSKADLAASTTKKINIVR